LSHLTCHPLPHSWLWSHTSPINHLFSSLLLYNKPFLQLGSLSPLTLQRGHLNTAVVGVLR
jgi:hypothetical protein